MSDEEKGKKEKGYTPPEPPEKPITEGYIPPSLPEKPEEKPTKKTD